MKKKSCVCSGRKSRRVSFSFSVASVLGVLLINWIRPTPDELCELSGSVLYFGPDSNLRSWVDFSLGHRQIYLAAVVVARFRFSILVFPAAAVTTIAAACQYERKKFFALWYVSWGNIIIIRFDLLSWMLLTETPGNGLNRSSPWENYFSCPTREKN